MQPPGQLRQAFLVGLVLQFRPHDAGLAIPLREDHQVLEHHAKTDGGPSWLRHNRIQNKSDRRKDKQKRCPWIGWDAIRSRNFGRPPAIDKNRLLGICSMK